MKYCCLLLLMAPMFAGTQLPACKNLHEETFYYYDKVANNHSVYIREEDIQKEIARETKDTAIWRIEWRN